MIKNVRLKYNKFCCVLCDQTSMMTDCHSDTVIIFVMKGPGKNDFLTFSRMLRLAYMVE